MRLSYSKIVIFGAMAFAIAGCANTGVAKGKEDNPVPKAESTSVSFLTESCPITEVAKEESLIAMTSIAAVQAFAPAIVGFGYDLVIRALEDRADALTASTSTVARGKLYRDEKPGIFTPKPKCLVFIRGGFEITAERSPIAKGWQPLQMEKVNDALTKAGFPKAKLMQQPEVYAEFAITYPRMHAAANQPIRGADGKPMTNADGKVATLVEATPVPTAMSLRPVKVSYGKSGAKRNPDAKKQLVFQIDIKARVLKAGKWEDTTLLEGSFDLGMVTIGSEVAPSSLDFETSAVGTLIPPAEITVGVAVQIDGEVKAGTVVALDLIDISAHTVLTETQEGGDFERLIAKTARDKKDSILKPISDAIADIGKKKE